MVFDGTMADFSSAAICRNSAPMLAFAGAVSLQVITNVME
jgi:hypothetical protein